MNSGLLSFFPRGTTVFAIPNRDAPRLVASGSSLRARWRNTALYPAYRLGGRLLRVAIRCVAAGGFVPREVIGDGQLQPLRSFLGADLPGATAASILVGTPGPVQKVTVELRNPDGRVAAYGKYGSTPGAIARLEAEHALLRQLPVGVGPEVVRCGRWSQGVLLVVRPIEGDAVGVSLPPGDDVVEYLRALEYGRDLQPSEHAFIRRIVAAFPRAERLAQALSGRSWKRTINHGDFAPWNVRRSNGGVRAFDWEYGTIDGFPGIDLAFYWLQTLALIDRAAPDGAVDQTVRAIRERMQVDHEEAEAIVRLAALDAYAKTRSDGHAENYPIQRWRRELISDLL